jgi:hypothetical protein
MPRYDQYNVTGYMPSHKQHELSDAFTPERITELTGATPRPSKDGKCEYQWDFFAQTYLKGDGGRDVQVVFPCAIWDFKGSRWSAFGPREVFVAMGLLT